MPLVMTLKNFTVVLVEKSTTSVHKNFGLGAIYASSGTEGLVTEPTSHVYLCKTCSK